MTDPEGFQQARVLIVDDEERNLRVLQSILRRAGYSHLTSTADPRDVTRLHAETDPDIVLLDLRMPYLDGFSVLRQLRSLTSPETYLPIIILTADVNPEVRQEALQGGASDFLTKPFDATEVLLRIRNLLKTRFLNQSLEERVRLRTQEIRETQLEVLERLARASEFRDDDTGQHTYRVGEMAARLALELGLSEEHATLIRRAAPLHDVGKIGIPDSILLKPDKLTPDEFEVMKRHTTIGAALLDGGRSELVKIAATIALTHHERWNGSGYPQGLKAGEIPIEGRILSIVDVFDALVHERPYKKAWPVEEALAEIERQCSLQFDPEVVAAFRRVVTSDLSRQAEPTAPTMQTEQTAPIEQTNQAA